MTLPLGAYVLSLLVPALSLFLGLHQAASWAGRRPTPVASGLLIAACLILLSVPIEGLSVARRVAGLAPGFSLPFTALIVHATLRRAGGPELLRPTDLTAFWRWGALAGLILYPAALGWGRVDPYTAGWHFSVLFVGVGLLAALLLGRGHRLGWVLLIAIAAWHLRALESTNYWDYLVDPLYFLMAVPMALRGLRLRSRRAGR